MSNEEILNSDLRYIFELIRVHKELNSVSDKPQKKQEEEVYIDNISF